MPDSAWRPTSPPIHRIRLCTPRTLVPTYQTTQVLGYEAQGNHGTATNDGGCHTYRLTAATHRHAGTADLETDDGPRHRADRNGEVGQRVTHEQQVPDRGVQGVESST